MGRAGVVALWGSEGVFFSLRLKKSSILGYGTSPVAVHCSSGSTLFQWKYTVPVVLYCHWRSTKGLMNQAVNKKDGGGEVAVSDKKYYVNSVLG